MRLSDRRGRMKHAERKRYRNDDNAPYVTRTRASACYTTLATFRAIPPRIFIPLNVVTPKLSWRQGCKKSTSDITSSVSST